MNIITLEQIKAILPKINLIQAIEEGYSELSKGNVIMPPVGELIFDNPPGDAHIKYGYIKNSPHYVIKIASGFYKNYQLNVPNNQGLILVFSTQTGTLVSILLDEGYLTSVRTGIAGAIAAKYLAPKNVHSIGIIGTGEQAKMQLFYLKDIISCRQLSVYGLQDASVDSFMKFASQHGYNPVRSSTISELVEQSNLIITATPSTKPLIDLNMVQPGTHITAMGSDTPTKIELDPRIIKEANLVVTDSRPQSKSRGEIFHAYKNNLITDTMNIIEIGEIINNKHPARKNDTQLTIADFTGVCVQDIKIAEAVIQAASLDNL